MRRMPTLACPDQGVGLRRRMFVVAAMLASIDATAATAPAATAYDLIELGHDVDRSVSTGALAIDGHGVAAGWIGELPAVFAPDGRAERLGLRPGRAIGFDGAGRVVGRFFGADDSAPIAFVRQGARLVELPLGEGVAIGALAGPKANTALPGAFFAEAYASNRPGDVVGTSDTGVGRMPRAVLRQRSGRVVDLGVLADARSSGWRQLLVAYAINDRGAIVGVGTREPGVVRGFMLVPRTTAALGSR